MVFSCYNKIFGDIALYQKFINLIAFQVSFSIFLVCISCYLLMQLVLDADSSDEEMKCGCNQVSSSHRISIVL